MIVFWCCAVEFGSFWCIIQDDCCGEIVSLCKDCFVFSSTHRSGIMEIVWCSHVCSRVLSWWYLLKCLCSGDWFSMSSCLMLAVDLLLEDCDSLDQPKRWDWFMFSSTRLSGIVEIVWCSFDWWFLMLCCLIRFRFVRKMIVDSLMYQSGEIDSLCKGCFRVLLDQPERHRRDSLKFDVLLLRLIGFLII